MSLAFFNRPDTYTNKLGSKEICGVALKTFNSELLEVPLEKPDLQEHVQMQGSGLLYFNMLLQRAKNTADKVNAEYDELLASTKSQAVTELREESGAKRPTNDEINERSKTIFEDKRSGANAYYVGLEKKRDRANKILSMLEIWVRCWTAKSFDIGSQAKLLGGGDM